MCKDSQSVHNTCTPSAFDQLNSNCKAAGCWIHPWAINLSLKITILLKILAFGIDGWVWRIDCILSFCNSNERERIVVNVLLSSQLQLEVKVLQVFIRFVCLVLYLLWIRFMSSNLCCISKSMMKHQPKPDWKSDFRWLVMDMIRGACLLLP